MTVQEAIKRLRQLQDRARSSHTRIPISHVRMVCESSMLAPRTVGGVKDVISAFLDEEQDPRRRRALYRALRAMNEQRS